MRWLSLILILWATQAWAERLSIVQQPYDLETADGVLHGSLLMSDQPVKSPVALLIPGSGPTDRNGNNPAGRNAYLQRLANALAEKGIASVRYDKRGVGQSAAVMLREQDLKVSDYVADIIDWTRLLQQDPRFSQIVLIGHSEGALMASLAAPYTQATALILLAGSGRPIDDVLRQQMRERLSQAQYRQADEILSNLKQQRRHDDIPEAFSNIFRPSIQPYLITLFHHDPQQALAQVRLPCLIVHGSHDIQVSAQDAMLLAQAQPRCEQITIDGMNHFLRIVPQRSLSQLASYDDPNRPLAMQLTETLTDFIRQSTAQTADLSIRKQATIVNK